VSDKEQAVWGIHGGRLGAADSLFLNQNVVALGWTEMPDLSTLKPNRDGFKSAVAKTYPDAKPGAIPNNAGQLYRFVHEMQIGDLIVYPSKIDRHVHIGIVEGPYRYNAAASDGFPHQRAVRWLKDPPRTRFTQGALYEIGSAMTFFQVRNYADEFRAVVEGKSAEIPSPSKDESVAAVAEDIEETTRDFVLKRLAQELKGHPFAEFVAHLLNAMGYRTRVSPPGPDGGIDIVAHKDELGFEPPIIKVQVKSTEGSVGDPEVSSLYGKVGVHEFGLLVTLGTYTPRALDFSRSKSNLRLIEGSELIDLIFTHYEQFDSRYKGLLPLKRVYVPEVVSEDEE
jgi:restriction system protein